MPIGVPSHCVSLQKVTDSKVPTTPMPDQVLSSAVTSNSSLSTTLRPSTSTASSEPMLLSIQDLISECPSACNKDSVLNAAPEVPDTPELLAHENLDVVDTNATSKLVTANPGPYENKIMKANTTSDNTIHDQLVPHESHSFVEELTTKSTIRNGNMNKLLVIHGERPVEIKDLGSPNSQLSTASASTFSHELNSNDFYRTSELKSDMNEPAFIPSSVSTKKETLEMPTSDTHIDESVPINSKDETGSIYNDKKQNKHLEIISFENGKDEINKGESVEVSPISASAPSNANNVLSVGTITAAAAESVTSCFIIQLTLKTDTFNVSLGSDEICPQSDGGGHGFNITYNVPISKYLKDRYFELVFM